MPVFATPEPIALRVELASGSLRVAAADQDQSEVEVRPADPASDLDLDYAQATLVEFADGMLLVKAPDQYRQRRAPSLHVTVTLPTGSSLHAETASADLRARGRLADVEVSGASGDVVVQQAANFNVKTASGDVRCDVIEGDATVGTASGDVRLGAVHGQTAVKTASGDLEVKQAGGDVTVRSASGDLKVGSITRGKVLADSASGDIGLAVAGGTAAWLDVSSLSGRVRSHLESAEEPADGAETVEVRARTLSGDITIERAR